MGAGAVSLFWIGLILLAISYIFRKKNFSKALKTLSAFSFFFAFIVFAWWGIARLINFF